MKASTTVSAFFLCVSMIAAAWADDCQPSAVPPGTPMSANLQSLLTEVGKQSKKQFLVRFGVPAEVLVGTVEPGQIDYATLLTILNNNGLAAVNVGGIENIVPVCFVRGYGLPIINQDDASIPDTAWVTRILHATNIDAAQLVPVLRPLIPQEGHLVAVQAANSLIIVDRYANVRRIQQLIAAMDKDARQKR